MKLNFFVRDDLKNVLGKSMKMLIWIGNLNLFSLSCDNCNFWSGLVWKVGDWMCIFIIRQDFNCKNSNFGFSIVSILHIECIFNANLAYLSWKSKSWIWKAMGSDTSLYSSESLILSVELFNLFSKC